MQMVPCGATRRNIFLSLKKTHTLPLADEKLGDGCVHKVHWPHDVADHRHLGLIVQLAFGSCVPDDKATKTVQGSFGGIVEISLDDHVACPRRP